MHVAEADLLCSSGSLAYTGLLQASVSNLYSEFWSSFLKTSPPPPLHINMGPNKTGICPGIFISYCPHVHHDYVSVSLPLSPSFLLSLFPFLLLYLCSRNFPFCDRGTEMKETIHPREVRGSTGAYCGTSPFLLGPSGKWRVEEPKNQQGGQTQAGPWGIALWVHVSL